MGKNIVKFHTGFNNYKDKNAIKDVSNYLFDHPENELVEGINVSNNLEYCASQMHAVKKYYEKEDKRQLSHFTISNKEFDHMTPEEVCDIGVKCANLFGRQFQILMAVNAPTETSSRHIHYLINSVGINGKKFHMSKDDLRDFKENTDQTVEQWKKRNGISFQKNRDGELIRVKTILKK